MLDCKVMIPGGEECGRSGVATIYTGLMPERNLCEAHVAILEVGGILEFRHRGQLVTVER